MIDRRYGRRISEQRIFAGLAPQYVETLAAAARERELARDEVLIHHGDPAHGFYLVLDGRISREVPAILGPPLVMHSIGRDELLGWSWLIPPHEWSFLARAEEATAVLEFDGTTVLAQCEADPKFGYEIVKRFSSLMSERLVDARRQMMAQWNPAGYG